jgi:hypothetical protein
MTPVDRMRWLVWSMKSNWPYAAVRDKQVGWVETDGLLIVKASPKCARFIGSPVQRILGANLDFGM